MFDFLIKFVGMLNKIAGMLKFVSDIANIVSETIQNIMGRSSGFA